MKILSLFFIFLSINIFSQEKSCEEIAELNKKYYNEFVEQYKNIDYKAIQDIIIKELDCIQFNSDVDIRLNYGVLITEGPTRCPNDSHYMQITYVEQQIWNPRMLSLLRKKIPQNIFPSVRDQLNEYRFDDSLKEYNIPLGYLSKEQIDYINSNTENSEEIYNTKYFSKNKPINRNSNETNKMFYELHISNNNIELTLHIYTSKRSYIVNYFYDFANKIWK